jgi:glycosyltransferase involved in cell wall biosynthesis
MINTSAMPAMKSKPTISVLMAVYNAPENYLDAAITSIIQQSNPDFEFIIVDDGSDISTSEQLRMWADRDRRIRLHRLPANVGLTKALNAGLQLARGDYLARQDADDISGSRRLEAQLKFLTLNPQVDAVGTDAILIDVSGNNIGDMKIDPKLQELSRRNLLVHGSMLFRRHVFDLLSGYDERMQLSQDYELYLRMLRLHVMQIGVLSEAHYRLRQHTASLSSRRVFRQLYYSVLAKSLTEPHMSGFRSKFHFLKTLFIDFCFTHRLLLGHIVRSCSAKVVKTK